MVTAMKAAPRQRAVATLRSAAFCCVPQRPRASATVGVLEGESLGEVSTCLQHGIHSTSWTEARFSGMSSCLLRVLRQCKRCAAKPEACHSKLLVLLHDNGSMCRSNSQRTRVVAQIGTTVPSRRAVWLAMSGIWLRTRDSTPAPSPNQQDRRHAKQQRGAEVRCAAVHGEDCSRALGLCGACGVQGAPQHAAHCPIASAQAEGVVDICAGVAQAAPGPPRARKGREAAAHHTCVVWCSTRLPRAPAASSLWRSGNPRLRPPTHSYHGELTVSPAVLVCLLQRACACSRAASARHHQRSASPLYRLLATSLPLAHLRSYDQR